MPCQPGRRRCHFRGFGNPWRLSGRVSAAPQVVVVNTCSVTAEADRDARAYIRRVQRSHPQARIVVTGCYAQRAPDEIAALPGVFAVVGNSHKSQVASIALGPFHPQAASLTQNRIGRRSRAKNPTLLWQPRPRILCLWRRSRSPKFRLGAAARRSGVRTRRRYLRAQRFRIAIAAVHRDRSPGCIVRCASYPANAQNSGWLRQSLHVLHHSFHSRQQPIAAETPGARISRAIHCRRRAGTRPLRHQSWPLGPRPCAAVAF